MPAVQSYLSCPLQAVCTVTASGLAVHVRELHTAEAVCDVRLSPAELRAVLERVDALAALEETVEMPALPEHTIQGGS
jgi:hypothetical protein